LNNYSIKANNFNIDVARKNKTANLIPGEKEKKEKS